MPNNININIPQWGDIPQDRGWVIPDEIVQAAFNRDPLPDRPQPQPVAPQPQLFTVPVFDDRGRVVASWIHDRPDSVRLRSLPDEAQIRILNENERNRPRRAPDFGGDIRSGWADFEKSIKDVFAREGFTKEKSETVIGLELENETLGEFSLPRVSGWQHHTEGSLRNFGFEYVQATPSDVSTSLTLCNHLLKYLKKNAEPQQLLNSSRTSTHVHFDVTKYTFKDVLNFACTYWILEEYLSNFCGNTRKGNLFCLRLKDSSAIQVLIKSAISSGSPWGIPLSRNDYRYSSVNFASIPKFGSLEFRMMAGTDNLEDIETWVKSLDAIKRFALRFKTPTELGQFFIKEVEARQFPRTVLGADLAHRITSRIGKTPGEIETEIRSGFMMVYPMLAAHGTWDFTKEIAKETEKLKEEEKRIAAEREAERIRFAAIQAARANFPPIPNPPVGQDEMPDNVDDVNLVEIFNIADE